MEITGWAHLDVGRAGLVPRSSFMIAVMSGRFCESYLGHRRQHEEALSHVYKAKSVTRAKACVLFRLFAEDQFQTTSLGKAAAVRRYLPDTNSLELKVFHRPNRLL